MYKIIVNETEYDLLPKLKELNDLNIDLIHDRLTEAFCDEEINYELIESEARELTIFSVLSQYIESGNIDQVVKIIQENHESFDMYEIVEVNNNDSKN